METYIKKQIIISLKYILSSTIVFGFVYTFAMTAIGQFLFHNETNGSLVRTGELISGSKLIGQKVDDPGLFWGRPSAGNYETMPSAASNYGAISKSLKNNLDERLKVWQQFYPEIKIEDIPAELLLASGSGLDPHISPEAALFQVNRIAKYRHLSEDQKEKLIILIQKHIEPPQLYFLGYSRINVLELNMDLARVYNGLQ